MSYFGKRLLKASTLQLRRLRRARQLLQLARASGSLVDIGVAAPHAVSESAIWLIDRAIEIQQRHVTDAERDRDSMADHTREAFDHAKRARRLTTESDFDRQRRQQYEALDEMHTQQAEPCARHGCLNPIALLHDDEGVLQPAYLDDRDRAFCSQGCMDREAEDDNEAAGVTLHERLLSGEELAARRFRERERP